MKPVIAFLCYSAVLLLFAIFVETSCKKETKHTIPEVSTDSVKTTSRTSANCQSRIISDGGTAITERGVCWNSDGTPTIINSKTSNGAGTGNYTSVLTGLTPGKTYTVRAYATNNVGIAYGSSISFTTDPLTLALVDIDSVTGITSATANSGGNVTEDGGAAVSGRGICWSLNSAPTINDNKTTDGSGTGSYTSAISGILPNTTYYTRAYATNITGTGYSATLSLTTLSIALPELTTRNATVITQNSALSGGTIIKDGNSSITAKGVCWSTNPGPTTDDEHTNDGSGKNGFTSEITNLEVNTKYYIRSYAVNSVGTGYGPQVQLTTLGYYTGLVYGGGVIFYVDSTGRHGLIAAINDQGTDKYWYNGLFVQTGATARAIGSGNSNTQLIVSHMVGTGFAAEICYHLSLGGYDDWFLPSQDELSTLFNLQGTGQLSDNFYWSSTESGSTGIGSGAWYSSGNSFGYGNELFKAWVRAIRAF